jgi:hypothetical protein
VVDAENAVFGKGRGHRVIDMTAGVQIRAQRLFKADAAGGVGQTAGLKPRDGGFEQPRRGRQEDRQTILTRPDLGGQIGKLRGLVGVQRLIGQALKAGDRVLAIFRQELVQRIGGEIAKTIVIQVRTGRADDVQLFGTRASACSAHSEGSNIRCERSPVAPNSSSLSAVKLIDGVPSGVTSVTAFSLGWSIPRHGSSGSLMGGLFARVI